VKYNWIQFLAACCKSRHCKTANIENLSSNSTHRS